VKSVTLKIKAKDPLQKEGEEELLREPNGEDLPKK